jgi:hypothetical protein
MELPIILVLAVFVAALLFVSIAIIGWRARSPVPSRRRSDSSDALLPLILDQANTHADSHLHGGDAQQHATASAHHHHHDVSASHSGASHGGGFDGGGGHSGGHH